MPIGGKMLRGVPAILDYDPVKEKALKAARFPLVLSTEPEVSHRTTEYILDDNGNIILNPNWSKDYGLTETNKEQS
jgi:hypothetical protein